MMRQADSMRMPLRFDLWMTEVGGRALFETVSALGPVRVAHALDISLDLVSEVVSKCLDKSPRAKSPIYPIRLFWLDKIARELLGDGCYLSHVYAKHPVSKVSRLLTVEGLGACRLRVPEDRFIEIYRDASFDLEDMWNVAPRPKILGKLDSLSSEAWGRSWMEEIFCRGMGPWVEPWPCEAVLAACETAEMLEHLDIF